MKKILKKIISFIIIKLHNLTDFIQNSSFFNDYLIEQPLKDIKTYISLSKEAEKNTYSFKEVKEFESKMGYSIDKEWLNKLALKTQVVIKKSPLNYAHGRVLYSSLRNYLKISSKKLKSLNVVETGTARGFSSLCMAKALFDSEYDGKICTIDIIPHDKKIFWNSISDHQYGKITRGQLLKDWSNLIERYIFFIKGTSKDVLKKHEILRIHFAFLDANHTFNDVMYEFYKISKSQKSGDIIVFDDYNPTDYPGVFKAINLIESNLGYNLLKIINSSTNRGYVIATKI